MPTHKLAPLEKDNIEFYLFHQLRLWLAEHDTEIERVDPLVDSEHPRVYFRSDEPYFGLFINRLNIRYLVDDKPIEVHFDFQKVQDERIWYIECASRRSQLKLIEIYQNIICGWLNDHFQYLPEDRSTNMRWVVEDRQILMYQPNRALTGHSKEEAIAICRALCEKMVGGKMFPQTPLNDFDAELTIRLMPKWHLLCHKISLESAYNALYETPDLTQAMSQDGPALSEVESMPGYVNNNLLAVEPRLKLALVESPESMEEMPHNWQSLSFNF